MNLLLLFTNLQNAVGGIPHYNQLLTRALRESNVSNEGTLTVLALHDASTGGVHIPAEGARPWRHVGFEGNRFRFVQAAVRAGRAADIVVFGHAHFAPLAWVMPKARKCLVAHGIEVWDPLSAWRLSGIRRMQQIWSVSRFTRDRLIAWSGLPASHCQLLPNTLAPEMERSYGDRASLQLPTGPILLTVSRLDARERYKNIENLLESVSRLPEVFLVVVGEGSDRLRLQHHADSLGISERVRFTGEISDDALHGYYEACDVFALPSIGEGFGIVFLEAMSRGKPCVGARAGGITDVIEDAVTGYLIDPGRRNDLTETLARLFSDPNERRRLGAAGRARFENKFAYPHFCRQVETLIDSDLHRSPAHVSERRCA